MYCSLRRTTKSLRLSFFATYAKFRSWVKVHTGVLAAQCTTRMVSETRVRKTRTVLLNLQHSTDILLCHRCAFADVFADLENHRPTHALAVIFAQSSLPENEDGNAGSAAVETSKDITLADLSKRLDKMEENMSQLLAMMKTLTDAASGERHRVV